MFRRIDAWILDSIFQRATDGFRDRYGRTLFWLAATCAWFFAGVILVGVYVHNNSVIPVVLILVAAVFTALSHDLDDNAEREGPNSTNWRRDSRFYRSLRLVVVVVLVIKVVMIPIDLSVSAFNLLDAGLALAQTMLVCATMYFAACSSR